jgi:CheY-like chemotaxis protein
VPHTLLLADDSVTIQRVIELTFADEDIQVIAVSDGDQAVARLEAAPPDIVLADIGMPGRNGYEVAQYIKQSPHLAHIPVVLLTGAFEPVDQARAADAGCDGMLAKPFEPQLVIARVKELLARPRSGTPSPDTHTPTLVSRTGPLAPVFGKRSIPEESPKAPADPARLDKYFEELDAAFADLKTTPAIKSSQPEDSVPPPPDEIDWFGATLTTESPAAPNVDLMLSYSPPVDLEAPPQPAVAPVIVPQPSPVEPPASSESFGSMASLDSTAPPVSPAPLSSLSPRAPESAGPAPPASSPPSSLPSSLPALGAPLLVSPAVERPAPHAAAALLPVPLPPPLGDAFAALLAAEQREPLPSIASGWPSAAAPTATVTEELVEQVTRRVLDRLSDRIVRETVADIVSKVAERLAREEIERIKASVK